MSRSRTSMTVSMAAAASWALAGCGARVESRAQWTIAIATDAPLPQFADRLLVEILSEDGSVCPACRRQFGLGPDTTWPLSFGVVPRDDDAPLLVRARLYRSAYTGPDGLPSAVANIDYLGRLPSPRRGEKVVVPLAMRCFGQPVDLAARTTCDPATGARSRDLAVSEGDAVDLPVPGSWPPAALVPCGAELPPGMICIPGGAFLLGSPRHVPLGEVLSPLPEHTVKLGPFALDRDEFTVGQVRALLASGALAGEPVRKGADPASPAGFCTYQGPSVAAADGMPVNCVSHDLAEELCGASGKRLPTEAEWEYAGGNRSRETPYPWGDDEAIDVCSMAIVGRGRVDVGIETGTCRNAGSAQNLPPGPVAGGSPVDATDLGVRNMGGNLSEWVAGAVVAYTDACWTGAPLLVDPRCDRPAAPHAVRGGSWAFEKFKAGVVQRNGSAGMDAYIGFRCAKSM